MDHNDHVVFLIHFNRPYILDIQLPVDIGIFTNKDGFINHIPPPSKSDAVLVVQSPAEATEFIPIGLI